MAKSCLKWCGQKKRRPEGPAEKAWVASSTRLLLGGASDQLVLPTTIEAGNESSESGQRTHEVILSYSLLATHYSLLTAHCSLHPTHYTPLLLTTRYSPLTTRHSPLTTHHSPLTTHHAPLTTYRGGQHAVAVVAAEAAGVALALLVEELA